MAAPEPGTGNADQVRYWNETAGPKWVAFQTALDAQLDPLGRAAMDRAGIGAGEHVLDVGCGCGATTLDLGRRVGPGGRVLGVDVSGPMLARAAEAARAASLANVGFETADAQTHRLPPRSFDLVYSRFGIMFFSDAVAAFTNLRAALRPAGRLGFICWQSLPQNAWLFVPLQAAAQHLTIPPPTAADAPGPFSLADPDRVRDVLARAGFEGIVLDDLRGQLVLGGAGSLDDAVRFLMDGVGPTSAALREADPGVRPKVAATVRDAIAPFHGADGVRMDFAAWIVTAGS